MDLPADIFSTTQRLLLFPVRHHSPTAARLLRAYIEQHEPGAVLIEGPRDFNDRIAELALPHELPIAIYSYLRLPTGERRGAYYPYCQYSPEWQAMLAGLRVGAQVRFIDLPYADIAVEDGRSNRYADAELRRSAYVKGICEALGVEGFSSVWDALVEQERDLDVAEYLRRVHTFCGHIRLLEGEGSAVDRRREAYMAAGIREALDQVKGQVLVVTGGFHSLALYARIYGADVPGLCEPASCDPSPSTDGEERGIALTPYSYERLDSLTGYDAGMPNPGFYDQLWLDREKGRDGTHRHLLAEVVRQLRQRKQRCSSAELIAAESCARALARLRGREEVWRHDLVDGVAAALVKDELAAGGSHPMLDAIHEALRGNACGALAEGTALPPLVLDIRKQLRSAGLEPTPKGQDVDLELTQPPDREKSRLLHRLRILGIAGFTRTAGTDFTQREDLSRLWDRWTIRWSPEYDSSSVEASRYGPSLPEAAAARLAERATQIQRDARAGAALLLDCSLADANAVAAALHAQLLQLIRQDADFIGVTGALGHLVYLYHYDETMGSAGRPEIGTLLSEAFSRGLWLLETLGQVEGDEADVVAGVHRLLEAFERTAGPLGLDQQELVDVLRRVQGDTSQAPAVRGAVVGALWVLGSADVQQVQADINLFANPDRLGDFLSGLFALAREIVQRNVELIRVIDSLLVGFPPDQFMTALPSLRLAFTYFTPREKHQMARQLLEALGGKPEQLAALEVPAELAAAALAFEIKLFEAARKYGVRGGNS